MAKSDQEIIEMFKTAVRKVENKEIEQAIQPNTDLADLGLSSVSMMEVIGELEEQLGVHFADDDLAGLKTFAHLASLVRKLD